MCVAPHRSMRKAWPRKQPSTNNFPSKEWFKVTGVGPCHKGKELRNTRWNDSIQTFPEEGGRII